MGIAFLLKAVIVHIDKIFANAHIIDSMFSKSTHQVRAHKKVVSLKPGSDSCYSRSLILKNSTKENLSEQDRAQTQTLRKPQSQSSPASGLTTRLPPTPSPRGCRPRSRNASLERLTMLELDLLELVVELKEDHKVDMMGDLLLGGRSEWPTRDRPCQGKTLLLM